MHRGLLLPLVSVLCYGLLAPPGPPHRDDGSAEQAAATITRLGGTVVSAPDGTRAVDLFGVSDREACVRQLRHLPDLRALSLLRSGATDATLERLRGLADLRDLDL